MIGKRLREIREIHNLLQKKVAKDMKLSQQTISLYESDKRNPDLETLIKLADYFHVTTDYLLGIEDFDKMPIEINTEFSPLELELIDSFKLLNGKSQQHFVKLVQAFKILEEN